MENKEARIANEYLLLKCFDDPNQHEIDLAGGDVTLATRMHDCLTRQLREMCQAKITAKIAEVCGNDYINQCIEKQQGIDHEKINALQKYTLEILRFMDMTKANF